MSSPQNVVIYFVAYKGTMYEANLLDGTYYAFTNPDRLGARQRALTRAGVPWTGWAGGEPATMSEEFGVEVMQPHRYGQDPGEDVWATPVVDSDRPENPPYPAGAVVATMAWRVDNLTKAVQRLEDSAVTQVIFYQKDGELWEASLLTGESSVVPAGSIVNRKYVLDQANIKWIDWDALAEQRDQPAFGGNPSTRLAEIQDALARIEAAMAPTVLPPGEPVVEPTVVEPPDDTPPSGA